MSSHEDEADAKRVLSGEVSCFEGIVRRWQTPLVNLAYRFCRDRGRAEELAQEALVKAYRGLPSWRQEAAFSTWLFALATNHYRSAHRAAPSWLVSLDSVPELAGGDRNTDDVLQDRGRQEEVRAAVVALPAKYRDALTLYYFHEMDVSSASRSLDIPEGTLKARLLRGRGLLRSKLARGTARLRVEEAQ